MLTEKDEELIGHLRLNAREPVASLARKLGLSRTTVQDRLRRLEERGIIAGYAVKLAEDLDKGGIRADVTLEVEPKRQIEVARSLAKMPQIEAAAYGERQVRPGGIGAYEIGRGHG